MKYDDLVEHLGEFGPYQRKVYFLTCLPAIAAALQTFIPVFILAVPDHRCAVPGLDNDTYEIQGEQHRALINYTLPHGSAGSADESSSWGMAECYIISNRSTTGSQNFQKGSASQADTEPCNRWVYDQSVFLSTFVSQTNMVCDKSVLRSHANMIYMAGVLTGSIAFGVFADLKGRKVSMFVAVAVHVLVSMFTVLSPNFAVFAVLRFFTGFSNTGMFLCAFVLGMELVGRKWRTVAGVAINLFWCTGDLLLAGLAYGLRDWQHLQLAASAYGVLLFALWWLIPESPRWLISKGRLEEAQVILEKIAESNSTELPKNAFDDDEQKEEEPKGKIKDLFANPVLAFRIFVVFLNWLVVTMVYYGLTLNVGSLGGSIYVNFVLNSAVEMLGNITTLLALSRFGRKRFHCLAMLLGAVACLCCVIPVVIGPSAPSWAIILLSNIGKYGVTGSFSTIYVFSAELFPTSLRNSVIGSCSMIARIGGMISPYIADLGIIVRGEFGAALPYVVFGGSGLVAALLALTLPETLNMTLPETIQDAKDFGKKTRNSETKYEDFHTESAALDMSCNTKKMVAVKENDNFKTNLEDKSGKDNKGFEAETTFNQKMAIPEKMTYGKIKT